MPLPRCPRMTFRALGLATVLLAVPAAASAPAIHVEGWARAGLANSAAYLSIHNGKRQPDRLLGASSPAARSASVHNTVLEGGVMRMRGAGALTLPAGGRIEMKPGGTHVMLMGLKAPLRPGTRLPLTLRFERAGTVNVTLPVLPPGTQAPRTDHHGH